MRKKQIRLYPDFSIVTLQIVASSWRTATPVSREQGAKILAESSATFPQKGAGPGWSQRQHDQLNTRHANFYR